jgi:hypothetical protein
MQNGVVVFRLIVSTKPNNLLLKKLKSVNIAMKNLYLAVLLFSFNQAFSQWTKINSIPSNDIVFLAEHDHIIYAASDSNLVYSSSDNGLSWNGVSVSATPADITCMSFFNEKIYVGTYLHGIFHSADSGHTWQHDALNTNWISGLTSRNNVLYASTLGNGIIRLDSVTGNWVTMNDSLPTYSVNVNCILGSPDYLIAAAGSNGTFYKYDFNNHSWVEGFYYGILKPGLQINCVVGNTDSLIVVSGNKVIRSFDAGLSWSDDKIGTPNGADRRIFSGSDDHYLLTNMVPSGTWIEQRDRNAGIGSDWSAGAEFLAGGYSYSMLEQGNKLFLGKNDGLYVKSLSLDVEEKASPVFKIYPNPSADGVVSIESEETILSLQITGSLGTVLMEDKPDKQQVQLHLSAGIYFVRLNFKNSFRCIPLVVTE